MAYMTLVSAPVHFGSGFGTRLDNKILYKLIIVSHTSTCPLAYCEVTLQRLGPGMQGKPGSITRRQTFGSVTTGYWHIRPDPPISSDEISHILWLNCCKLFCFVLLIFLWMINVSKYPIFYKLNKESTISINKHWKLKQHQQQQNRQVWKGQLELLRSLGYMISFSLQPNFTINALNTVKSSCMKWTIGEKQIIFIIKGLWTRLVKFGSQNCTYLRQILWIPLSSKDSFLLWCSKYAPLQILFLRLFHRIAIV